MAVTSLALWALLFAPPDTTQNAAHIFVYAQPETAMRSWRSVFCDGVLVARIKRGFFFTINVAPGRHMLTEQAGLPIFIDVRPGVDSFIRVDREITIGEPEVPVLSKMSPEIARKEMRFLPYIGSKNVLSQSVCKTDRRPFEDPHFTTRKEEQ